MTDEHKFCFIICANDEQQLQECVMYLNLLHVPEGYQADLVVVRDAVSMAAGYNEGMAASDAKYKIYLHQDVFIVYPMFLDEIVRLFHENEEIGMIGMVGAEMMSSDGVMWHETRYGNFYGLDELVRQGRNNIEPQKHENRVVEVIDGFLMATQYDLSWREDAFQGWDFYDASQCMEFARAGYKVMVPAQEENWVIHCCKIPALWKYNEERKNFLREYPEIAERRRYRKRILFLHSRKTTLIGIPCALTLMGYNVMIPVYKVCMEYGDKEDQEEVEELLEEGNYDLVVTYDFSPGVSNACQNFGVPYYAWVFDAPFLPLYDKAALNEVNYVSMFDRKEYGRLMALGLKHLYYLPLAPEVENFGAVNIGKEDEEKYTSDVSFVGRLYNNRGFEQIFDNGSEAYRKEAEKIVNDLGCVWDGKTSVIGKASEELIAYMVSREPEGTWEKWNIDKRYFCESMRLTRKCNEVERTRILQYVNSRFELAVYSDDLAKGVLQDIDIRPELEYGVEMPKVFHLSRINLNISSRSIETGIPQRVWDIMAVGGFCLTNYQPELEEYFEIGRDLEVYHNLSELGEKIAYYLAHEKQRLRIAINGYQKVRKLHSLQSRLREVLQQIF